jgi:parallel beta-helix repeat protein
MLLVRADVIVQRVHFFASAGIAVTRGRPTIRACSFTYGWAAILVHSASAFIEDCEMTGGRGVAIQVVGWPLFDALAPKASVLIRRNVIQGGDPDTGYDTGIRVDLGASVLIEDNRIEDIRRGGYSDDRGNGIELLGSGRIDVRRNLVRNVSGHGIRVAGGARPKLTDDRLLANRGAGIVLEAGKGGLITGNVVEGNGRASMLVARGTDPSLGENVLDVPGTFDVLPGSIRR